MPPARSVTGGRRFSVLLSIVGLVLLAAVVGFASAYMQWLGDDVDYGFFIFDSIWNSHGSIDSVTDFLNSQGNHYMHVNGRTVAHALVQLFCAVLGQTAFAVCNALVYCLFVWLLVRMGTRRPMEHPLVIWCVGALVLLTFVTKMMPTTQIGFVWMFVLNLLWLRLFFSMKHRSAFVVVGIALLSLMAGNSQEALTPGIAAAMGLWWLYRRGRVPLRQSVWLACYVAGMLVSAFSPGTLHRAAAAHIALSDSVIYLLLSLRATWVAAAVVLWMVFRRHHLWKTVWRRNKLWFTAWVILLLFNLVVGIYSNRQLFGMELCALAVTVRVLRACFNVFWTIAFVALASLLCYAQITAAAEIRRQYSDIEQLYATSERGVIYYDRTHASENPFLREFRWYEEIVGQYNNDTHHSLQKRLHKAYPEIKPLNVWPEYMEGRKRIVDTVVNYAPGHYAVFRVDARDTAVVIYRESVLPMRIKPDTTTFERSTVTGRGWKAAIILSDHPFARNTEVRLEPVQKKTAR